MWLPTYKVHRNEPPKTKETELRYSIEKFVERKDECRYPACSMFR